VRKSQSGARVVWASIIKKSLSNSKKVKSSGETCQQSRISGEQLQKRKRGKTPEVRTSIRGGGGIKNPRGTGDRRERYNLGFSAWLARDGRKNLKGGRGKNGKKSLGKQKAKSSTALR